MLSIQKSYSNRRYSTLNCCWPSYQLLLFVNLKTKKDPCRFPGAYFPPFFGGRVNSGLANLVATHDRQLGQVVGSGRESLESYRTTRLACTHNSSNTPALNFVSVFELTNPPLVVFRSTFWCRHPSFGPVLKAFRRNTASRQWRFAPWKKRQFVR